MRADRLLFALVVLAAARAAGAGEAPAPPEPAWHHAGMLRVRDLTPFGLLRLDLRPPHFLDAPAGGWTFEVETSYQNTFVLSRNVEDYLRARGGGRRPLDAADAAAILELPGDAYYVDGELGLYELIVQRQFDASWSGYLTLPYLSYRAGLLDRTIEGFHRSFGFSQQGRDLVARDRFQYLYDIDGIREVALERPVNGGFNDPVIGLRYSPAGAWRGWDVVVDAAAKIAVDGERRLLSTGRSDYGLQLALQRSRGRHAAYLAAGVVYYAGTPGRPVDNHLLPTVHAAWEYGLTRDASLILQGYLSESVMQDREIPELSENKYQLSIGLQFRALDALWSVALTENISNFMNTPDVVVQLGIAWPDPRRRGESKGDASL